MGEVNVDGTDWGEMTGEGVGKSVKGSKVGESVGARLGFEERSSVGEVGNVGTIEGASVDASVGCTVLDSTLGWSAVG